MFSVLITNEQSTVEIDTAQIELAVNQVVEEAGVITGDVSVAIVDDPTMHQLNIEYLNHDYPTDVLSFVLERDEEHLEGDTVMQVLARMDLVADVDAVLVGVVQDRRPALCKFCKGGLDQARRALRPGIKKRPGERAGKSRVGVDAHIL